MVADSSAIVSLVIETDSNHQRAVAAAKNLLATRGAILVPCEVLAETTNLLGKKSSKETAVKTAKTLLGGDMFLVVETGEEIWKDALTLFEKQPSDASYIDCIVMATARFYGLTTIFGFDRCFPDNNFEVPSLLSTPT